MRRAPRTPYRPNGGSNPNPVAIDPRFRPYPLPEEGPHPYPANTQVVGRCSQCGGLVTVPLVWHGVVPPTPTCASCGAVESGDAAPLPVIPLGPAKTWGDGNASGFRIVTSDRSGE